MSGILVRSFQNATTNVDAGSTGRWRNDEAAGGALTNAAVRTTPGNLDLGTAGSASLFDFNDAHQSAARPSARRPVPCGCYRGCPASMYLAPWDCNSDKVCHLRW